MWDNRRSHTRWYLHSQISSPTTSNTGSPTLSTLRLPNAKWSMVNGSRTPYPSRTSATSPTSWTQSALASSSSVSGKSCPCSSSVSRIGRTVTTSIAWSNVPSTSLRLTSSYWLKAAGPPPASGTSKAISNCPPPSNVSSAGLITASRQEPRQNIQVVLIGRIPRASNFVEYRLQVSPINIQTTQRVQTPSATLI